MSLFFQQLCYDAQVCGFFFFLSFVFCLFRATPVVCGGSHARGLICWPMPEPQQCQTQATSATYTTGNGNTGSLTYWARPGIEPTTSWLLVRSISAVPRWKLWYVEYLYVYEQNKIGLWWLLYNYTCNKIHWVKKSFIKHLDTLVCFLSVLKFFSGSTSSNIFISNSPYTYIPQVTNFTYLRILEI